MHAATPLEKPPKKAKVTKASMMAGAASRGKAKKEKLTEEKPEKRLDKRSPLSQLPKPQHT